MRKTLALLFVFFILLPSAARSEERVSESLDWLTITRPSIAIASVNGTAPINKAGSNNSQLSIQAHITFALKGHPPAEANFVRRWQSGAIPGQDDTARPENGTEYMLFFNDRGDVTNAINLLYPSRKLGVGADSRDVAIGSDFSVLKSRELILDLVQQTLAAINAAPSADNAYLTTPKKVEVPMASAAWDALYESGECFLLIPDDSQKPRAVTSSAPTLTQRIDFDGGAFAAECSTLPRKPFLVSGTGLGLAQHMTFRCNPYVNSGYKDMTQIELELQLTKASRNTDYEFTLDVDPVEPGSQKPYFGADRQQCEFMAKVFNSRIRHDLKFRAEGDAASAPPMNASWKVDCKASDRWGFVLLFQFALRPNGLDDHEFADKEAQAAAALPKGTAAVPALVVASGPSAHPGPGAPPVQSPLSAAMAAPTISTTILTAAPVVTTAASDAKAQPPINQTIDFNGVAPTDDCARIPTDPYELPSEGSRGSPQKLTIRCGGHVATGEQETDKIVMTYQLTDAPRNADYDFTFDYDPDPTKYRKPMFGEDHQKCEYMAHMLSVRIPPQLRFMAAGDPPQSLPMNAAWRVDCVTGKAGYVLAFKMALRPPGSLQPTIGQGQVPSSALPLATPVTTIAPSAAVQPVATIGVNTVATPGASQATNALAGGSDSPNLVPRAVSAPAVAPRMPSPAAPPPAAVPRVSDLPFLTQAPVVPRTDGTNPPAKVTTPAETVRALPPAAAPKDLPPMVGAPPQ